MSFLPQPSSCCDRSCNTGTGATTSTETAIQVIAGSFADPNGNVTPDNLLIGAEYYQDINLPNIWRWSVTDQMWFSTISYA